MRCGRAAVVRSGWFDSAHAHFGGESHRESMSEESARIYERAENSDAPAGEAWERTQELGENTEWDIERMLPELDWEGR